MLETSKGARLRTRKSRSSWAKIGKAELIVKPKGMLSKTSVELITEATKYNCITYLVS